MVAYRVYDDDRKEWVKEDVYLNQNGELFKIKQSFLFKRLSFLLFLL